MPDRWIYDAQWSWTRAGGWQPSGQRGPVKLQGGDALEAPVFPSSSAPPPPYRYAQRWAWYANLGQWQLLFEEQNYGPQRFIDHTQTA